MTEAIIRRASLCYNAASSKKAIDLIALDLRGLSDVADVFLIATGRSRTQVQTIVDAIEAALRATGDKKYHVEGYETGRWALIDAGDVVAHVFDEEARDYYGLQRLWADAKPFPVETLPETGEQA